jgi:hypothetical protein
MAPALGPAFLPENLERIDIPLAIVAGPRTQSRQSEAARDFMPHAIPHAEPTIFSGDVGHYVLGADCTEAGRATLPERCIDAPGVDRGAIHAETVRLIEAFFARHLR